METTHESTQIRFTLWQGGGVEASWWNRMVCGPVRNRGRYKLGVTVAPHHLRSANEDTNIRVCACVRAVMLGLVRELGRGWG